MSGVRFSARCWFYRLWSTNKEALAAPGWGLWKLQFDVRFKLHIRLGRHFNMHTRHLREDALAIWSAGLEAVRSDRLVRETVKVVGERLVIGDQRLPLAAIRRIVVVGAGKAGAGMAAGLEEALGPELLDEKQVAGWVNVPEDCVRPLRNITLHGARPAGVNEPTEAGVYGAEQILRLVDSLENDDLCLCLISGGGSALLPAPVDGVTLADKQAVTRHLSAAGANINELNAVRKRLSRIKGGGLSAGLPRGTADLAHHFRRAGGPARCDRLGTDRRRRDAAGSRAGGAGEISRTQGGNFFSRV
jgi:hypothetical protein